MFDKIFEYIDKKYLYAIGGFFLFFMILLGINSCSGSGGNNSGIGFKKNDYPKIEETLVKAAEEYYAAYPQYKPDEGETTRVKAATLYIKGFMQELSNYTTDEVKCSAEVAVSKVGSEYKYTPYLDCGKDYSAIALYDYIINNDEAYTLGSSESKYNETKDREGLYKTTDGSEYFFRGEIKNNYLKIGDYLWRIVKIDKNNYITIIFDSYTSAYSWDNRYNSEVNERTGINDFNISVIRERLGNFFDNDRYIPEDLVGKFIKNKWCIGKRDIEETDMSGVIECSELSEESYVGTLAAYEILRISLDHYCENTLSKQCTNYNYLKNSSFWTLTGNSANSYEAYYSSGAILSPRETSMSFNLKYALILNNTAIRVEGSGTYENPYLIK